MTAIQQKAGPAKRRFLRRLSRLVRIPRCLPCRERVTIGLALVNVTGVLIGGRLWGGENRLKIADRGLDRGGPLSPFALGKKPP